MFFTPENAQDIDKYFRNSFLKFKDTGDTLAYITSVDKNTVTGTLEDGREFKLYLAKEAPYEVDYVLPHKSFFQFQDHAVLLERVPAKQFHRGLTDENTQLSSRNANGDVKRIGLSWDALKAFVNKQKFFTLSEALESKNQSCVLCSRMMLTPTSKTIFVDFAPVAKVLPSQRIRMLVPVFREEIEDFLKTSQEDHLFTFVG
jgi:hypothetical protein